MASTSKTPNLNLPQWVGTEKPERTDFNAAFLAIDNTTRIIVDHTLASDAQTVTFSDLDINTHKSYTIELDQLHNSIAATSSRIYMFVNGDTTQSNYRSQLFYAFDTTRGAVHFSEAIINETQKEDASYPDPATSCATIRISIRNGILRATSLTSILTGVINKVQIRNYAWVYTQEVTNLTSLTFAVASGMTMKAGDKFRIYRGDR